MSLGQLQYVVMENDDTLSAMITLDRETSEDVTVEVTVSNGSANGNI